MSMLVLFLAAQATTIPGAPSLIQNPQQGATPRPLPPPPPLPTAPPVVTSPVTPVPVAGPRLDRVPPPVLGGERLNAPPQTIRQGVLPLADRDPLHLDLAADPVLRLAHASTPVAEFRQAIAAAVARNPALDEAAAQRDEAAGVLGEAKARRLPVVDLGFTSYHILSRAFSDDPDDVLERLRPRQRTDATVRVQQPLFDFGAALDRVRASRARLDAAAASVDDVATQLALRAVSAWYGVYGYRALVGLGDGFVAGQRGLRGAVEQRVRQGYAAPGDLAQIDGYIAAAEADLAGFRRQLANAEAQYAATIGMPAPATLGRAPEPDLTRLTPASAIAAADMLPAVKAARLGAEAAKRDAGAARADLFPQVTAGADYGRYGVFETDRDYDLRANVTLGLRFGGGAVQRLDQAKARAAGADARARRTRDEAARDARIAVADVAALTEARDAIEANYIASRRSRDVIAERFRVARGTLFDLVTAENNFFSVAARYVQTVTELDTARYALLARTGGLLDALAIAPTGRPR